MLNFEQKKAIAESFPELRRKDVSLGRVNYQYEESTHDKKNVVYHLHPNGNGFVYTGLMKRRYETDDKGFTNIRDFGAEELRTIIGESIRSLAEAGKDVGHSAEGLREELWLGPDHNSLVVKYEDDLWYVFAGSNLEMALETYEEVEEYMAEEGFVRSSS